jgi:hypothetical protein
LSRRSIAEWNAGGANETKDQLIYGYRMVLFGRFTPDDPQLKKPMSWNIRLAFSIKVLDRCYP